MVEIRPATHESLRAFYGAEFRATARAFVATSGGRVIGVAGFRPEGHRFVLWTNLTDELRADKRALVRGLRVVMGSLPTGVPVHATADEAIPGAEVLLEHVGFRKLTDRVWEWVG